MLVGLWGVGRVSFRLAILCGVLYHYVNRCCGFISYLLTYVIVVLIRSPGIVLCITLNMAFRPVFIGVHWFLFVAPIEEEPH